MCSTTQPDHPNRFSDCIFLSSHKNILCIAFEVGVYFRNTFFIVHIWFIWKLGEHPAAMQRGAANANIDLSIVLYIVTLSLMLQQVIRISHGYGISYDVIRWIMLIRSKFMTSVQCYQHLYSANFGSSSYKPNQNNNIHQLPCAWKQNNQHTIVCNESVRCVMRWKLLRWREDTFFLVNRV